jgi:hypothetical protein
MTPPVDELQHTQDAPPYSVHDIEKSGGMTCVLHGLMGLIRFFSQTTRLIEYLCLATCLLTICSPYLHPNSSILITTLQKHV